MPPRRRSKKSSQKETDERLSVAETIAGLANSIEQPAFSTVGVRTRQNSYEVTKSPANFSELPAMVVDEMDTSTALPPASLHSLPLPTSVYVIANQAHKDTPTHGSQPHVCVQNQPSVCNAGNVNSQSQLSSTVTVPGSSQNITSTETGRPHADTVSAVPLSLNPDAVFSAVLMGWNPPVLASCPPPASIESVPQHDVYSPLSALKTVDSVNNNSCVEVLKLPLVLEPVPDGTWQLVPMSASAPFGASVLPSAECVIQAVAQQTEHFGQSIDPLTNSVAQASVGRQTLLPAIDGSQVQLPSLGSLSVLGSYYNRPTSTVSGATRQELPGGIIGTTISCSGRSGTSEASPPGSSSAAALTSSEDGVVGGSSSSPNLGSLSTLRDYYKRISSTGTNQLPSLAASDVPNVLTLAASVRNNDIRCTVALQSKTPASVCNEQVVQPVLWTEHVLTASHHNVHTELSEKLEPAGVEMEEKSSLSRVLPVVSVDDDQNRASFDTVDNQLVTVSSSDVDRLTAAADGHSEQRSCELLRHLPLKKRQKVSNRAGND